MRSVFTNRLVYLIALPMVVTVFFGQVMLAQLGNRGPASLDWQVEPFYKYRNDGKPGRVIRLILKDPIDKGPFTVLVICDSVTETSVFNRTDSFNQLLVLLPPGAGVDRATTAEIILAAGGEKHSVSIPVPPKKQWTVFIYPHSHVDIGYTGLQEDVEKIHVRNIDVGMDLARKTKNYPAGARFIWNTESTWVVDAYLKKATQRKKDSFFAAVRKGWIKIDAGHSNINTTSCSDEELVRFFKNSNEIEKLSGVPISTMVQMDLPGGAWGLAQAAVQNGVTSFISFPNTYDVRRIWEHKPFYWRGPDGKSRILFLQAFPYGIGYTIKGSKYGLAKLQTYSEQYDRVSTDRPTQNFIDAFIFDETAKLEKAGSPYDLFVMAWSMADNCVIDADLPEAVKQWNTEYAFPKLEIAGAKEIMSAFEKKYGKIIPEYSGDFTEFWTNGLGSDAKNVGRGRHAKENLVQAETISVLLNTWSSSKTKIDSTWESLLLSAEHTWGYQNPTAPLARVIEQRKAAFFSDAERQSLELLPGSNKGSDVDGDVSVINTLSWPRGGIVTLKAEQSKSGDRVLELSTGKFVLSQRLTNGELIFLANDIPALCSRMYRVVPGSVPISSMLSVSDGVLKNGAVSVVIDDTTGDIRSVVDTSGYEFVDNGGINSYHYVRGVSNGVGKVSQSITSGPVTIAVKERGSLKISVTIRSSAEGMKWLEREVALFAHQPVVQISNTFDKIGTRQKEGVHFGFAFRIPSPVSHVDAPWSIIVPERDQLAGANRNWMTFQRWVDISNHQKGITWTAIEAPLIEWGEMSGHILDGARQFSLWKKKLEPVQTVYSWPINNHWDTNFPLEQSGIMEQQYAVLFHGIYDQVTANRFGMEQHRPLIPVVAKKNLLDKALFTMDNRGVVLSGLSTDETGKTLVRLRSVSPSAQKLKLRFSRKVRMTVLSENETIQLDGHAITLPAYGTGTLSIEFDKNNEIIKRKVGNNTKTM